MPLCHIYQLMPSLEEVCIKLLGRPGWAPKVLVGGALSFIPLLNLIPLGYLLEYTIRLKNKGSWDLPDWKFVAPLILFKSGFRFLVLLLTYTGCPILIGCLVSILLDGLTFGILGIISYFPVAVGAFIGPFLFLAAIHAYLTDGLLSDAFKINLILDIVKNMGLRLILPVIAFWGIILLALPLYGFSFFIGTWILLAYSSALHFSITNKK